MLQLKAENIIAAHIECPPERHEGLGVTLPLLTLQVKPLGPKAHFSLEVQITDDTGVARVLRASNYVSDTRITGAMCHFPVLLESAWQAVTLDLARLCHTAFGTQYRECSCVVVQPNIRLRRVYFAEAAVGNVLPPEFVLRTVTQ